MNDTKTAAPRADDAAAIRELLASMATADEAGDLDGMLHAQAALARDVTAYLDGEANRLPAYAGSPAMRVVAAIPVGMQGNECIAVVEQPARYTDGPHYGTVYAYRNDREDGTVAWSATAGDYDYLNRGRAIRAMITRAGIEVTS